MEELKNIESELGVSLTHLKNPYRRYIPNKVRRYIERLPKKRLNTIHSNREVAKEYCLLFLSNLSNSYYLNQSFTDFKNLNSALLTKQMGYINGKRAYRLVRDFLLKERIIETDNNYIPGVKSRGYRLTLPYFDKGVRLYTFLEDEVRVKLLENYVERLREACENPISISVLKSYVDCELPTKEELMARAEELIASGYTTNKGKRLKVLGKHSKHEYDSEQFSFVEEDIKLYERLCIENGFIIPAASENAGGRVTSSFTLMPSWIRDMVTIKGEKIVEKDYSTLHPNIVNKLFGLNNGIITHDKVSEYLGIDRKVAKIEHLSFFNKPIQQMKLSPLWGYYEKKQPILLERVINNKLESDLKYKSTSRILFREEVELMTEVIIELLDKNISVIYVYDALYCAEEDSDEVHSVMDKVAKKLNINTFVG